MPSLLNKIERYYQRNSASLISRKPIKVRPERPLISFTFDDFPKSALTTGGAILHRAGLAGTYYTSFGLMGRDEPSGRIFTTADLDPLLAQGHELACHTFAHCHSWDTSPEEYERSIVQNQETLDRLLPGLKFRSFSYPISAPRPSTKSRVAKHFESSRGGGQIYNLGSTDLNQLSAYFLEKTAGDLRPVKSMIDQNARKGGWLVFATHDVQDRPTPYGCTPKFFEDVVCYSIASGAQVLPVASALDLLRAGN